MRDGKVEIITGTTDFQVEKETAVAIGKFDGVHIGHRRLLDEITEKKKQGLSACVFTFDPSPAVFFGNADAKELNTREEKRILLERIGIDILVEFPLDAVTAAISAQKFISDVLVARLNAGFVAAGEDLSFGDGGRGDAALLKKAGEELGFQVKTIQKICVDQKEVSSTRIRDYVEKGEMGLAEKCLGIPYPVMGKVVHGRRLGRTIGFPTVNLVPNEKKILPPNGVYYSDVVFRGKRYEGVSNVGVKPTVAAEEKMGVETFIRDFSDEIYDEEIEIYLKEFRRPEMKFDNVEKLREQLERDISEKC